MARRLHPPASQHNNLLASSSDTSRRRVAHPLLETNLYTKPIHRSKHSSLTHLLLLRLSLLGDYYT